MTWFALGTNLFSQITTEAQQSSSTFYPLSSSFQSCIGISFSQIAWKLENGDVCIRGFNQELPIVNEDEQYVKLVGKEEFIFGLTSARRVINLRNKILVEEKVIDVAVDGVGRLVVLNYDGSIKLFDQNLIPILVPSVDMAPNEQILSLHALPSSIYAITSLRRIIPLLIDPRFPSLSTILEDHQIVQFSTGGGRVWAGLDDMGLARDSFSDGDVIEIPGKEEAQIRDIVCGSKWIALLTQDGEIYKFSDTDNGERKWIEVDVPVGKIAEMRAGEDVLLLNIHN